MREPTRVRLKDIAEELGLSIMTVSRAINNHPNVKPGTRLRVVRTAKKLNYRPNRFARSLITRRSMSIALIVPDISYSFFGEVAKGVQAEAAKSDYCVLLCNTEEEPSLERKEIETLMDWQVDGIIIATCLQSKDFDAFADLERFPHVFVDRRLSRPDASYVVCDDYQIGYQATEHLIKIGHRRIAHFSGPNVSTTRLRRRGYRKALEAYGLTYREDLVWKCGFLVQDGYEACGKLLGKEERPDAIFCVNDPVALGAIQRLDAESVQVPQDVAVVGAADLQFSSLFKVPLTTVHQPAKELGARATGVLLQLINGSNQVHRVVLPAELIVRESCGARLQGAGERVGLSPS